MKKEKYTSKENLSSMMSLDIYLNSLSQDEYQKVVSQIHPQKKAVSPLMSWEYFMMSYSSTIEHIKRSKDVSALESLRVSHQWQEDPAGLLTSKIEGLVLTNSNLVIEWVNPGFTDMTGYSSGEAIGKTPRFLQGENTSEKTRKRIREHIKMKRSFKESIINYRKNREEYMCEIHVFPLKSNTGKVSHFLALEKEVR